MVLLPDAWATRRAEMRDLSPREWGSWILAYLFLDEVLTTATVVAAVLVLTGIYVASRAEFRGTKPPDGSNGP